jgi:hypothetical protein
VRSDGYHCDANEAADFSGLNSMGLKIKSERTEAALSFSRLGAASQRQRKGPAG